ncbi:MAG: hypothetical protein WKF80_11445 [Thermomicrobiales bacterium]
MTNDQRQPAPRHVPAPPPAGDAGATRPIADDLVSPVPVDRLPRHPGNQWSHEPRESMVCAFRPWSVPRAFPVVHRPSPATRRLVEVAAETDRVLLCDDAHPGPHMWPTGEMVPMAQTILLESESMGAPGARSPDE